MFVGIYLDNSLFELHGELEAGKTTLVRLVVRWDQLLGPVTKLPPCAIGMEVFSCANHWA